jgi:cardiolipin synthase C
VCLALIAGCAQLPEHPDLPVRSAVMPGNDAALDRMFSAAEIQHSGASGFRLVVEGVEAFVTRMQSAHLAERSIDVQTYIWHEDPTGLMLARQLLQAADRGVHVRLLLDDLDARAKNAGLAALAAHPNIEVRLFNPFASRSGGLRMAGEGMMNFGRINRRMHNKSWIADNRVALVGGRNLGDEYFAASDEVNFVDLDFAMVGPVVRDISASFDRFWNSPSAWPIQILDPKAVNAAALEKLRAKLEQAAATARGSHYAQALRDNDGIRKLTSGEWPLEWATNYRFVSDDPAKVSMTNKDATRAVVAAAVVPLIQGAQQSLKVISPYFVPGDQGAAGLIGRVKAGAQVQVLTNSLAANDVATVHGGYSRHRKLLIEGGVQIWELKPTRKATAKEKSFSGSSGASLHTKAMAVDDRELFVGSYNLDPRSTWLNCEQGVFVEDAALSAQLSRIFALQATGSRAWRVTEKDGKLTWSDDQRSVTSEPSATWWRRFQAWFARAFNMDAQL